MIRNNRRWSGPMDGDYGFVMVGCAVMAIVGLLVGSLAVKACGGLNIEYSDGTRSGYVTKLSHKGMIWKTYEGELDLRRMKAATNEKGETVGMVADIFYYSVTKPEIVAQLQAAERSGARVTLEYKQYILRGWKYGGTSYDVVGVVAGDDTEGGE